MCLYPEHVAICHSEKAILSKVYFLVSEEENYRLYVSTLAMWSKVDERVGVGLKKASDFSYSFRP